MNILFTDTCNQRCPYCFSKGKMRGRRIKPNYLRAKNLDTIIAFAKKSQLTRVGIIGGEPTLHPDFKRMISRIIDAGLGFTIFSNGLMKKDIAVFLKGLDVDRHFVVINTNNPESYVQGDWGILKKTMGILRDSNRNIGLGFNIHRLDFRMDFLVDLIVSYNLFRQIRVGIAMPLFGGNNCFLSPKVYPRIAEKLVAFIERFRRKGISFYADCGFISCSFTDEQLGKLLRGGTVMEFNCAPTIDIGPDLTLWRCFATSKVWNKKLSDFNNLQEVGAFYLKKFQALSYCGVKGRCHECEHFRFGRCAGGCLGHTQKSFKLEDKITRLR